MDTTDAYATGKANLRDTVKWLATVFAGLAAVVVAGSPFSGFGALPPGSLRFWLALGGLLGAAVFLFGAWRQLLFLLRPDAVFESELRGSYSAAGRDKVEAQEIARLRQHLVQHKDDLIPDDLADFDALQQRVADCWAAANAPGAGAPALEKWKEYTANVNMILNYAAFARLQQRITDAIPGITVLGVLALICLVAFSWAANPGKGEAAGERVTIVEAAPVRPPAGGSAPALPLFAPVRFPIGKSGVDAAGIAAISAVRDFLRTHPEYGVLLLAHTDTLGDAAVNRGLASRRGAAVRRALTEPGGIQPSRIFVAELPRTDLPAITPPQAANAENRSVEMLTVRLPSRD